MTLAEVAEEQPEPPAIALVHDPKQAPPLDGVVPLILAGPHARPEGVRARGRLAAHGRGLDRRRRAARASRASTPSPLTCTVLYLDPETGALRAYDEITLGGLGETEVTIQRTVVPLAEDGSGDQADETDSPAGGTPASPTG